MLMGSSLFKRFRGLVIFILLAAMVTVIAGTIYSTVQQAYREGANDPQIEAADTIADLLNQGAPADAIVGQSGNVDMAKSLSLFIMIFDKDGKAIASSGKLNDNIPTPPSGVFDYLKKHTEERFTWQPEKGTRIAAVIKKVSDDKGYVLVGRNLREVEMRERNLTIMVGIAWVALLALSGLLTWALTSLDGGDTIIQETEIINLGDSSEEESVL
jgi:hypothetical protein